MTKTLAGIAILTCAAGSSCFATQLIANGTFETGTLSGWTVTTEALSYQGTAFYASNSTTTTQSMEPTVGAKTGSYYAVSDSGGSGTTILSQTFTIPAGSVADVLSFNMFVNNSNGPNIIDPAGNLDYSGVANQYGIVSLLSAGSSLYSTTAAAGDLHDFYKGGSDSSGAPLPYTSYSFNIAPLVTAGQTYILRFAEVSNQAPLNMGIDNVSLIATPASATPEPASLFILLSGFAGVCLASSRRFQRSN